VTIAVTLNAKGGAQNTKK